MANLRIWGEGLDGGWIPNRALLLLSVPILLVSFSFSMAILGITDVTVAALCETDHCDEALYISMIKSAVAGFGTMLVTPIIGSLSDIYGRKPFFVFLYGINSIPNLILSFGTTRTYIYGYYVVLCVVSILSEGSFPALLNAYMADLFPLESLAQSFGFVGGLFSLSFVAGTLLTHFIPLRYLYPVCTILCICGALFTYFFIPESLSKESNPPHSNSPLPELSENQRLLSKSFLRGSKEINYSPPNYLSEFLKNNALTLITLVAFLCNFTQVGFYGSHMFYLKAVFGWNKDQFSNIVFISGFFNAISQFLVLPFFTKIFSVESILILSIFVSATHVFLDGIAWSPWVIYCSALLTTFSGLAPPCIAVIVSKCASSNDQGKVQGLVSGVKSFSSFLAPLVINPITAMALSDKLFVHCPGFGLVVASAFDVLALPFAIQLKKNRPPNSDESGSILIPETSMNSPEIEDDNTQEMIF